MTERSRPGAMDQLISFLSTTQTVDEAGGIATATTPILTARPLWARVQRGAGSETSEASKPTAKARAKIEMRFIRDIDTTMRVLWQGEQWEIVSLDAVPRHDRLYIEIARRGESGDGDAR